MADMRSGTGSGLLAFIDWAASKHEIKAPTAQGLRIAVVNVLQVEDDVDAFNVGDVDLDRLFERFEVRSGNKYSTSSLNAYKSRFRTAVTMYVAWLNGNSNWKTTVRARRSRSKGTGTRQAQVPKAAAAVEPQREQEQPALLSGNGSTELVTHTLPLRRDLLVRMVLPVDLTRADAERIANFVKSLAFDSADSKLPAMTGTTSDEGG
jgi:hypothetical protein